MAKTWTLVIAIAFSTISLGSCSLSQLATRAVADSLTSGDASTFTSDDDPQLIADALPFALKLYQTLLEKEPNHRGLITATGSGFIMYANAFVQTPAMMLPSDQFSRAEQMKVRAKKLYLRGRDILLNGMDRLHPGFLKALNDDQYDLAFKGMTARDVPILYWAAAGWFGAWSLDAFDFGLGLSVKRAGAMMHKALELAPDYGNGAIHEFYILYYGALPPGMGGSEQKAREQFKEAVRVSQGKLASPYVSLATAVSIKTQNLKEFEELMKQALAINPDDVPATRLMNIISQEQARWYMDHLDQFFVSASDSVESDNATNP
ncbi:MAG TPA: TRAP transporter TatT component family protein [Spirochaetia bacterium]|nr:TRAP transporter TatT component family protein [Spirochaetia bacterium]